MKRVLSALLIVCLVVLYCSVMVVADEIQTGITVNQTHSSYAQWSNQSPLHTGELSGSDSMHPLSLAIPSTVIGNISATAPSVVIDVSNPLIGHKDTIVYVGFYVAYGVFHGSNSMATYFTFSDDIPGYTMRAAASTSYGPVSPGDLTVTAPSNFSPTVRRTQAGSSSGATFSSSSVTTIGTYTPVVRVPQSIGSAYMEPYWKVASNSYNVLKVSIGSNNDSYSNVRIELDANDISKVAGSGSSGNYLMSGVFVPLCFVVDTTDYEQAQLDKLDDIINTLTLLNTNVSDGFADVVQILDDNFSDILASIGTSTGPRDNVLSYFQSMLVYLNNINSALNHQTGAPNAFSSAINYIEYYMLHVMQNTDTMVQYLADITGTLESISDSIESANESVQDLADSQEDVHDQEQQIYDDTNQAIGNTVISSWDWGEGVMPGLARASLDFTDLWNSLGVWNKVYTFSMTLTLCFTIIRHLPARKKQSNNKGGNTSGSTS